MLRRSRTASGTGSHRAVRVSVAPPQPAQSRGALRTFLRAIHRPYAETFAQELHRANAETIYVSLLLSAVLAGTTVYVEGLALNLDFAIGIGFITFLTTPLAFLVTSALLYGHRAALWGKRLVPTAVFRL